MQEVLKAKSYKPTQAMINNAKRGLALREKYGRGGLDASQAKSEGVGSGVARARDIINGNLTLDTVKRMYSFFSRHEKNYDPKKKMPDGGPTAGTVAYLLWSGSAGFAWARSILKKEGIVKSYNKDITDLELNTEDDLPGVKLPITKALDEELRVATFVVLEPQYENMMTSDLHRDWYSEEEIFKAMMNFNQFCMKASLFHMMDTNAVNFVESYCTKADMILNERYIKKGTWLASIYCPPDNETSELIWQGIKDGTFTGLSIQCMAEVETIDE
jgi:hypothetical protein